MVGFDPAIKKNHSKSSKETINPEDLSDSSSVPDFPDFSLPSLSIPDFDFIDDWIMETVKENCKEEAGGGCPAEVKSVLDRSDSERVELVSSETHGEFPVQETSREVGVGNQNVEVTKELGLGSSVVEEIVKVEVTEAMEKVSLVGASESCDLGELNSKVNEEKGKGNEVSLVDVPMNSENDNIVEGGEEKETSEIVKDSKDNDSSDSESEDGDASSTTSSDSSSSIDSSSDEEEEEDEEEKMGEAVEVEEGEIRDFGGSDDDEAGVVLKGPIKSKNEVQDLPPVPKVDVSLEPHHQTLPVGVVLSIMDAKVIVGGVEKHNPLSEGSVLWITETRSLLGLIDEIFGPVKNPYYVVRYNSEKEVPTGISEGTPISFVEKFAEHVLNDKNIYKKGYDASGENDEEISDEAEFSDDEKEAEFKRMQRMAKRGPSDDKKHGNREFVDKKKFQNKSRARNNNQPSVPPSNVPPNQLHVPSVAAQAGSGSSPFAPSTSQVPQAHNGSAPPPYPVSSNMAWTNGLPYQQNFVFPNGFPMNGMPFQQPSPYYQHQTFAGFNGVPMPRPFDPSQRPMLEPTLPYGQSNFPPGIPAAMPMFMGQPGFNQGPFAMGFQGFHSHPHINPGEHGVPPPGPLNPTHMNEGGHVQSQGQFNEQNHGTPPPHSPQGNFSARNRFNRGATPTRGGRSYRRGGRHPNGGRGRGKQDN